MHKNETRLSNFGQAQFVRERETEREREGERERENKGRQLYLWLKVADILAGSCTADTMLPLLPLWLALCLGHPKHATTLLNPPQLSSSSPPQLSAWHEPRFAASLIGALFVVIGGLRRCVSATLFRRVGQASASAVCGLLSLRRLQAAADSK